MPPAVVTAQAATPKTAPTSPKSNTGGSLFIPNQLFASSQGPLPLTSRAFNSAGGTLMIFASGSGSSATPGSMIGMTVQLDGTTYDSLSVYTNEAASHKTFVSNVIYATLPAGSHTATLTAAAGTVTDSNDVFSLTSLELPSGSHESQTFDQQTQALPLTAVGLTTYGGPLVMFASGSGFSAVAGKKIGMSVTIDGASVGVSQVYVNEVSSHRAFVSNVIIAHPAAGNHTVGVTALSGTSTDFNDIFSVASLELPSGVTASTLFDQASGPLPLALQPVAASGTIVAFASGSAFVGGTATAKNLNFPVTTEPGQRSYQSLGTVAGYVNEVGSHKALVSNAIVAGLCSGNSITVAAGNAYYDSNDIFSLIVLAIPVGGSVPLAPASVTASVVNGYASANLSWPATTDTGGVALDCYIVSTSPPDTADVQVSPSGLRAGIGGLSYGTTYTFTVRAINAAGSSASSPPSNPVIPKTTPGVPTGLVAYAENSSAVIDWTAPPDNGCPIDKYIVSLAASPFTQQTDVGSTGSPPSTRWTFTGLTNGQSYAFKVYAHNCVGNGGQVGPSNAVIPAAYPTAPPAAAATAGNAGANVRFTYPSGATTTITVTSSPGNITATTSGSSTCCNLTVSPLLNGQAYTFTVVAKNSVGSSAPSLPSNLVHVGVPYVYLANGSLAGDGEVFLQDSIQANAAPVTRITVTAYLAFSTTTIVRTFTGNPPPAILPFTGLTNGSYYRFTAIATNLYGDSPVSQETTNFEPLPTQAILPVLMNGAYGGYVSAITLMNPGAGTATYWILYFDQTGAPVGYGNRFDVPASGSVTVRQDSGSSFPGSGGDAVQAGSAIIVAGAPVAAFVNQFAPGGGDGSSYTALQPTDANFRVFAPTILNNAYGGYSTGLGLVNMGPVARDITITYADETGTVVKTQTVTGVPSHGYRGVYSGDPTLGLPNGFHGSATITSAYNLAVTVNEVGTGGQFSSYDAVAGGAQTLQAPVALNNAFGGYYTGIGLQNTTANAGTVNVTYNDAGGAAIKTVAALPITANGFLGIYQGDAVVGPPTGAYSATISVASGTIALAAIVNEVAPASGSARQLTTYNSFTTGLPTSNLALVESAGPDGWSTGLGIMNTGGATTVTVTYYDRAAGTVVGTPQIQPLAANAFWGVYQPDAGLPTGTAATAVVTTATGGQVAVICNESNATTFMSYGGR